MRIRGRVLVAMAMVAALWPAIVNGFPIVMGDSFRYLKEANGTPAWVSSQFYGYFLGLFAGASLWVPILVQAVVAVAVVWTCLRRVLSLTSDTAGLITLLTVLTSPLALLASLAMTDIWFGVGLLAALALVAGRESPTPERAGLAIVIAFAAAAHPAALPLLGLIALTALVVGLARRGRPGAHARLPAGTVWCLGGVVAALVGLTINNQVVWGTPSPNPHSSVVAFAYLLVHGDLDDELAACSGTVVCDAEERPRRGINAFNNFLFAPGGFVSQQIDDVPAFAPEATHHVITHVRTDPFVYVRRVGVTARRQLRSVDAWAHAALMGRRLGDGNLKALATYAPRDESRLRGSRQFRQTIDLGWHTRVGAAVGGFGAAAGLIAAGTLVLGRRRLPARIRRNRDVLAVISGFTGAYVAHAILVGTTTFAAQRYGGRMLWLLVLAFWIAVLVVPWVRDRPTRDEN